MRKEKGFTLTEMLGVLILLGLLLIIVVPSIQRYLRRGTSEYYYNLEETVKLSGRDYFNDYRALLPIEINNVRVIESKELEDNKYIDKILDSNGKECSAKVTAKKVGKQEYEYYSCLICEDYQTEGEACEYSEDDNITEDTKNYEIKVEPDNTGNYEIDGDGVYIVDQGVEFVVPFGKAYYKGELVNDEVIGNPRDIDTSKLETYKIKYAYKGAKTEITVKVVDRVAPSAPQIVLRKEEKKGKKYTGEWYSGDIYEEYQSIDYSKKDGILGSGIDYYEISTDGIHYEKIDSNYHLSIENGDQTYYIRSIDKVGNIGEANTYNVKIDKEIPTCSLKVESGILGSNEWYTSDITIGFDKIIEDVSDIVMKPISQTSVSNNTKGITITAFVTDLAGNSSSCSLDVKVDKDFPTISAKNNGTTYISWGITGDPIGYFNTTYSVSSGSHVCSTSDFGDLGLGINTITCTVTGGNGLSRDDTMIFKHQLSASGSCSSGTLRNNNACYFESNASICGTTEYDCNPYQCNPYDCSTFVWSSSTSDICASDVCDGSKNCDGHTDVGDCGGEPKCRCTESVRVRIPKTCYNTCYNICSYDNSCSKSSYLSYSCPTGIDYRTNQTIYPIQGSKTCNGETCTIPTCSF